MIKGLRTDIYSLNQEELYDYIIDFLEENKIKYNEHDGNIWGINYTDKVCFVSHLDTVAKDDDEYHKPAFLNDGVLFKINAILGADDRAGVNIILNHIKDVNFVFTRDEEIGRRGASSLYSNKSFKEDMKKVVGFIELDRRNGNDIIGALHGYCNKDFHDAVANALGGGVDARGAFTDIDEFMYDKPCVNISVGYYNAHSAEEYLDIKEWSRVNDSIPELNKISGEFKPVVKKTYTYTKYGNYRNTNNIYDQYFLYDYSTIKEWQGEYIMRDIKTTNLVRKAMGLPDIDINSTEDITGISKSSSIYMQCAICGEKINIGDIYAIDKDYYYHQDCYDEEMKAIGGKDEKVL